MKHFLTFQVNHWQHRSKGMNISIQYKREIKALQLNMSATKELIFDDMA
jgi:hypothetical protein